MLTRVDIPPYTLSGVSVGGVYTSLYVPQLDAIFDAGISPRSFVGGGHLFLSHAHADHVGSLPGMMGIRGLSRLPAPRTFVPVESLESVVDGVAAFNRGQHRAVELPVVPVKPGDEFSLAGDLKVRVFRTIHSIPSVGYTLFRRVNKLRAEFHDLPQREIAERRKAGDDLFHQEERLELSYATDTLIDVLDKNPELYRSKTLILECTFLDDKKGKSAAREKSHVHLDEIIERAELFQNDHLVLMHFSQLYQPKQVHEIMKRRLPEALSARVKVFAPQNGPWPG